MLRGRQTGLDLSAVQTPAPLKPAKRPHRNESRPRVTCERRGLVSVRLAEGGCVGSFSLKGFLGPSGGIPRSCLSVPFTSAPTHVFEQEQWQSGPSRCQKWQAVSEKRHDCVHTGPRGVRMSLRSCSTVRKPSPAPNKQTNKQEETEQRSWNSEPPLGTILFQLPKLEKGVEEEEEVTEKRENARQAPCGREARTWLGEQKASVRFTWLFFFFFRKNFT